MNRTVKFRGKRTDTGEWVYGYLTISKHDKIHKIAFQDDDYMWHDVNVIPESAGQFSGLFDRNGKEIYEGDIVETEIRGFGTLKVKIVWQEGGFSIYEKQNGYLAMQKVADDKNIILQKVVGNIHDDPKLTI